MLNDFEELFIYSFKEEKYFRFCNRVALIGEYFIEFFSKEKNEIFLLVNSKLIKTSLDVVFVLDNFKFLILNKYTIFFLIENKTKFIHNNFLSYFLEIFFNQTYFSVKIFAQYRMFLKKFCYAFFKMAVLLLISYCCFCSDKLSYDYLKINEDILLKTSIKKYFIIHSDSFVW